MGDAIESSDAADPGLSPDEAAPPVAPEKKAKPAAKKKGPAKKKPAPAKKESAPKKAEDEVNDGGVVALSGFLYQALGFAGLKALAEAGKEENDHEAVEVLVRLVREGDEILHEAFGQDVVIKKILPGGATEATLVQFKYSRAAEQIFPAELGEIVTQLFKAKSRAGREGHVVSKSFLVTNRPLSVGARELQKKPASGNVGKSLSQEERDLLGTLDISVGVKLAEWRDGLVRFGAEYGLTEDELRDRIPELAGYVIAKTVDKVTCKLDRATLADRLCRHAGSRSLRRKYLQPQIIDSLRKTADPAAGELVRRTVLMDARSKHADRALLVFVGPGGTGKTASMHWWTEQLAEEGNGRLVDFSTARAVQPDWMQTLLERWSHRKWINDTNDGILERLKIANPGTEWPLLHLSLDGLDEVDTNGYAADKLFPLIDWFWNLDRHRNDMGTQPYARLVISCRTEEKFLDRWLQANCSGHSPELPDQPPFVRFGRFNDEEFRELLRHGAPKLGSRILAALPDARTSDSFGVMRIAEAPPDLRPMDKEVVEALRDPSMWRAFYELDDNTRERALDGDPTTKRALGTKFVDRFCAKAEKRLDLDKKDVRAALEAVARANLAGQGNFHTLKQWMKAVSDQGALPDYHARQLLDEARSGGLVNEDGGAKWQWRNRMIENSLTWEEGNES